MLIKCVNRQQVCDVIAVPKLIIITFEILFRNKKSSISVFLSKIWLELRALIFQNQGYQQSLTIHEIDMCQK